jgi:hypothetical protein
VQKQTKLRTSQLTPNDNKSFSIGTVLMVDDWYDRLGLNDLIGQLGDNFSILQASEWFNRP